jgi:hypothetical protein
MADDACTFDAAPEQDAMGRPFRQRRVSDRLLAAHNHAYACGNRRVAAELRDILELIENDERIRNNRRSTTAVERASRWAAFVDAREAYEGAANAADHGRTQAARLRMHMAQELWRQGEGIATHGETCRKSA